MSASTSIERTLDAVVDAGAVLCVRLGGGERVAEACEAARKGGLRALEITLTTPGALGAIRALARGGDALVGAGTVLGAEAARAVADAGGRFIVSPVFDPEVVDAAHERGLLAIPGAATPTEILGAWRYGARLVKVFPARALGGPAFLRALRGPLPDVPLLPTSGPTADDLADYFAAGATAVGVGREVVPPDFTAERVEAAARRVREALVAARR